MCTLIENFLPSIILKLKKYIGLYLFNENVCLLQHRVKQKYSNQHTNLPYRRNTYTCPNVLPCCGLIFFHCIIRSADDDIDDIFYVIFSFLKKHTFTWHMWIGRGGKWNIPNPLHGETFKLNSHCKGSRKSLVHPGYPNLESAKNRKSHPTSNRSKIFGSIQTLSLWFAYWSNLYLVSTQSSLNAYINLLHSGEGKKTFLKGDDRGKSERSS